MKTYYISYNELKKQLFESNCHGRICFEANIFNTVRDYINSFISKLKSDIENNQVEGDNIQFESAGEEEFNITEVKNEMHEAVAQIKTEEDFLKFVEEYDSKVKDLENSNTFSGKTKSIIRKIWDVIKNIAKYVGKGIKITAEHWKLILFLVGVISVCVTLGIGPVEALKMAWGAAKGLWTGFISFLGKFKHGSGSLWDMHFGEGPGWDLDTQFTSPTYQRIGGGYGGRII